MCRYHRGFPHLRIDRIHLRLAALVAPDQRRPDHLVGFIQQRKPVHLSRQTDAAYIRAGGAGRFQHAANRLLRRIPPVLRPLFGPLRALHADIFVRRRAGVSNASLFVNEQGPAAAGANVNPEPVHSFPFV